MIKVMLKNEKGYALVLVLIIMLIFFMLGTVLIMVSTTQVKEAVKQQERVQAYYLAFSGAYAVAEWIMNGGDVPEGESEVVELDTGSFFVDVVENGNQLTITSEGTVDGYKETVVVRLNRESNPSGGSGPLVNMAVFAVGEGSAANPTISLGGSRGIVGPVGTNATNVNAIHIDPSTNCYIDGHFTSRINFNYEGTPEWDPSVVYNVPDEVLYEGKVYIARWWTRGDIPSISNAWRLPVHGVSGDYIYLEENLTYPDLQFPEFPDNLPGRDDLIAPNDGGDYIINQDGQYGLIRVIENRTLIIDLNEGVRTLRVHTLDVLGEIELINIGTDGKLMLYIDHEFYTTANSRFNLDGNSNHFNMFLKGNVPFTSDAGAQYRFVGNVVTENGNINIRAGSNITGNIFTLNGDVTIAGGGSTTKGVIYAPNSHVEILNGGSTIGAVVASTFYTSGGGVAVTYDEEASLELLPFNIFDNTGGTGNGGNVGSASWVNPVWSGD